MDAFYHCCTPLPSEPLSFSAITSSPSTCNKYRPGCQVCRRGRRARARASTSKGNQFLATGPEQARGQRMFLCVCNRGFRHLSPLFSFSFSLLTVPDGRKGKKSCSAAATFAVNRRQTERTGGGRNCAPIDGESERERLITSQEGSPCKEGKAEIGRTIPSHEVGQCCDFDARIFPEVTWKLHVKTVQ